MDEKRSDWPGAIEAFRAELAIAYHRLGRTADSARERALVGKLQSEGETRFFSGVNSALNRLLGKTDAAPPESAAPAQPRKTAPAKPD